MGAVGYEGYMGYMGYVGYVSSVGYPKEFPPNTYNPFNPPNTSNPYNPFNLRPIRPLRPLRRLGQVLIVAITMVLIVTMVSSLLSPRCGARCNERRYQQGRINKGRSPQNCIERGYVSSRPSDAILRDDELNMFHHRHRRARRSLATSTSFSKENRYSNRSYFLKKFAIS